MTTCVLTVLLERILQRGQNNLTYTCIRIYVYKYIAHIGIHTKIHECKTIQKVLLPEFTHVLQTCFADMLPYTLFLKAGCGEQRRSLNFSFQLPSSNLNFSCRLEATIEAQSRVSDSTLDSIFPNNFRTVFHGMNLTLLSVFFFQHLRCLESKKIEHSCTSSCGSLCCCNRYFILNSLKTPQKRLLPSPVTDSEESRHLFAKDRHESRTLQKPSC